MSSQTNFTFRFRRQPLKLLYTLYNLITIPFIKLPFFILRAIFIRPRPTWSLARAVYVDLYRQVIVFVGQTGIPPQLSPDKGAESARKRFGVGFSFVEPIPEEGIVGDVKEAAQLNGIKPERRWGYWYGPGVLEEGFKKPPPGKKMFYFMHGGGFVLGSAHPSDPLALETSIPIIKHCPGANVFAMEYRLAQASPYPLANSFPAGLTDVLSGYYYLVHTLGVDPNDIIVSGSSAGGSLAVGMVLYIIRQGLHRRSGSGLSLPLPRALWLESPAVDWGMSHVTPTSSMTLFQRSDIVGPFIQPTDYCVRAVLGNLPKEEAEKNVYISPASKDLADEEVKGLFKEFPDVALTYGGSEILRDVVRTLRDRLTRDLGKERVLDLEEPDCPHVFSTLLLHDRDKESAFGKVGKWYKDL
ncbi:hypothetical protein D9758_012424 [Tetrapyrgos nigripes]|uniref:Alpha/beta hydrolase fold-3 domain-containing protein n=1 Tax=Tetrapyrgos nigripes TaxID=182062 RepID=A0A8H5D6I8_9AGAR|nr:hypothetical protein D9758_012424 [Tetrapyrgos nigripes]